MHTVIPLQRSAASWLQRPGRIWLSWSIFNPNGPTVSCLGLRESGDPEGVEVFYRWQHLLGGEDYRLGHVDLEAPDARERLSGIFTSAFRLRPGQGFRRFPMVTSIPSLVVSNVAEDWLPLLRGCLEQSAAVAGGDWGRERYLLASYGNRLFDRAGEELREAYEHMRRQHESSSEPDPLAGERLGQMYRLYQRVPTFADWAPGRYASRQAEPGDFDAWWEVVTAPEFWPPAAIQLAQAWENVARQSSLPARTPMAEVREFYAAYEMPIFSQAAPAAAPDQDD